MTVNDWTQADLPNLGGRTVVVTHDPEVGAACDRVVMMRDGLIVGNEPRAVAVPVASDIGASIPVPALGQGGT